MSQNETFKDPDKIDAPEVSPKNLTKNIKNVKKVVEKISEKGNNKAKSEKQTVDYRQELFDTLEGVSSIGLQLQVFCSNIKARVVAIEQGKQLQTNEAGIS